MTSRLFLVALLGWALAGQVARADSPQDTDFWLTRAQADAQGLSDPAEKAGVLTAVGALWADTNNVPLARTAATSAIPVAQRVADANAQFHLYLGLSQLFDRIGDQTSMSITLAGAQSAADAIPAGNARSGAQRQLTEVRALGAGFDMARKPIDALPDPGLRAQSYAALAGKLAENAHQAQYKMAIEAAIKNVSAVTDSNQSGVLKTMIARAQADAGDVAGAEATAQSISDPADQSAAYTALATSYSRAGQAQPAQSAIAKMAASAQASPDDRKAAIWLDVARARHAQNDTPGARAAVEQAVHAADHLEPADRADATAAASRVVADLGDQSQAAVLAETATQAARVVTDPTDKAEVMMAAAAARARAGLGDSVMQCLSQAESAAPAIPPEKRHAQGDPPPLAYLDVIRSAAAAGDFVTARQVANHVHDASVKHDSALAIAEAEVNLGQYQAAETTAREEGSVDAEASVCGMIAGQLARTRKPADADQWVQMLPSASDKVAARLSVAGWLQSQARSSSTTKP